MDQAKFEARNPKFRESVRRKSQVVLPLTPHSLRSKNPNSELRTLWERDPKLATLPLTLDEVLLEVEASRMRKALFWGEGVSGISSYLAGWMAEKGIDVIVLDGANRFDPYRVSSFARKSLVPPERLLKRIRIARAFTCFQMATLVERLAFLLRQEEGVQRESLPPPFRKPSIILLGPITTFLDEDVPEREVGPLFERSLRKMEIMTGGGIPFFLFQPYIPFGSKGAYLMRRLFQFSNLVWKISLENEGVKLALEKGLAEDCRFQSADRKLKNLESNLMNLKEKRF